MVYYLAYKRIPKERFYALKRTGDYDVVNVFNCAGTVSGLRLCSRSAFLIGDSAFVKDSAYNQQNLNRSAVQLSLFDENENQ